MTYFSVTTLLRDLSGAMVANFSVVESLMVIAFLYFAESFVGVEPSVV